MERELTGAMFSYISKSQYHDGCTPIHQRRQLQTTNTVSKPLAVIDYTKCDTVQEDKIWRKSVKTEQNAVKQWQQNWGFLAEYNEKGELREKSELPMYQSLYSSGPVPNTNSGVYGSRVKTNNGLNIFRMEQALSSTTKKKKMDRDIICY